MQLADLNHFSGVFFFLLFCSDAPSFHLKTNQFSLEGVSAEGLRIVEWRSSFASWNRHPHSVFVCVRAIWLGPNNRRVVDEYVKI